MLHATSAPSGPGSSRASRFPRWSRLTSWLSALTGGRAEPPATRYNLLLISLDSCRADHLKCYGYDRDTSPHLDRLAREGVLFENASAAGSWTAPSHTSMFTALYPSVHGVLRLGPQDQLGEGSPTLAECLAQSGYVTAAFVTGPVLDHYFGFNRGFQLYDDFTVNQALENDDALNRLMRGDNLLDQAVTNPVITDAAAQWLEKHSRESFFLFLHYWDCHYDYIPPAPYDRKFDPDYRGKEDGRDMIKREPALEKDLDIPAADLAHMAALYDGEIAFTDQHVGRIVQVLQDLRLAGKTLVIVLSDHGEAFLEHGKLLHAGSLYEEVLHVPLIMRLPGVIPAGKRVAGNVSHVDLMPTALGLLQAECPSQIQGIDLSPAILSDQPVPERMICSEMMAYGQNLRAVRWDNRKLLGTMGTLDGAQLEELAGGREKVIAGADLKRDCPEAALRALLMAPPAFPAAKAGKANEPDPDLLRRLKSLGYTE